MSPRIGIDTGRGRETADETVIGREGADRGKDIVTENGKGIETERETEIETGTNIALVGP